MAIAAAVCVAYLLWPTWRAGSAEGPARIPVSIGSTIFDVPARAFRIKVQAHSGPQERVDLAFAYPSLDAPEPARAISAETLHEGAQPIDRIFVSIVAHGGVMAPAERARTIFPRYLDPATLRMREDGLTMRSFRDTSPYSGEDLVTADEPAFAARCSRDSITPGMCLSERRIENADVTFRFPRQWLDEWRTVVAATDVLTLRLHPAK